LQGLQRRTSWDRLARLLRQRRFQTAVSVGLTVLGPLLATATFILMGPLAQGASSNALRLVLLSDLVYFLVLAGLVLVRLASMVAARRAKSAGSRLHA
jgi:two-component system, NtrC family, nitrogen regulation sensor histidine kinase NtrY